MIEVEIPETVVRQAGGSVERVATEARGWLAIKYFELGQLNFGQAAAMAGMDRSAFLALARSCGLPVREE